MADSLEGLRILVVENEFMIAMMIREMIESFGGIVVGPAGRLEQAQKLAQGPLDGAILDVKLDGHTSLGLAEELMARNIPVVLSTGYEQDLLPARFADTPRLIKPYDDKQFRHVTLNHFRRS